MSEQSAGVLDTNVLERSDALIAASALANDLALYTCNPRDFEGIDGLRVVAIAHPDDGS